MIHMTDMGREQMMMLVSVSVVQEDSGVTFTYVQVCTDASLCSKPATILDLEVPVARGSGDGHTCTALWAARAAGGAPEGRTSIVQACLALELVNVVGMLHDKRVDRAGARVPEESRLGGHGRRLWRRAAPWAGPKECLAPPRKAIFVWFLAAARRFLL